MRVKTDGSITGPHRPSSEYPFHLSVYKQRGDIKAVLHAHSPALVAFSIVRRKLPDVNLIPTARLICGDIAMAPYALPGSALLGENIAAEFQQGRKHRGRARKPRRGDRSGRTSLQAFMAFETLEFCARLQMSALTLGTPEAAHHGDHRGFRQA